MKPARAWVLLPSGRRLNLLDPDPLSWTDEDLATGLSRTYCWAGYSAWDLPLSVAQHSLTVLALASRGPAPELTAAKKLRELLHDATEALLGGWDPITPLKPHLGAGYKALIGLRQSAVNRRYCLPPWDAATDARRRGRTRAPPPRRPSTSPAGGGRRSATTSQSPSRRSAKIPSRRRWDGDSWRWSGNGVHWPSPSGTAAGAGAGLSCENGSHERQDCPWPSSLNFSDRVAWMAAFVSTSSPAAASGRLGSRPLQVRSADGFAPISGRAAACAAS